MHVREENDRLLLTEVPFWRRWFFRSAFWSWLLPLIVVGGFASSLYRIVEWAASQNVPWRWIVALAATVAAVLVSLAVIAENRDVTAELDRARQTLKVRRPHLFGTNERDVPFADIGEIRIAVRRPRLLTGGDTTYALQARLASGEAVPLSLAHLKAEELEDAAGALRRFLEPYRL